jgi:hypothetical protein
MFTYGRSRWLLTALVLLLLAPNLQTVSPTPVAAQTASQPCATQAPSSGAYVARVCFTTPADGATLRGNVPATVTVTASSGVLPAISHVRFFLTRSTSTSPSTLLTDYANPWTVTIPTSHWRDGAYRLEARVRFSDGFETTDPATYARLNVTLSNGVIADQHTNGSWAPKTSGASPLNLVAVGDGAGGMAGADAVGDLVAGMNPDLFLYLGDVYNSGTYAEFTNYYDPTLGSVKDRTNPVPGNHESGNSFNGYMDYWNADEHYYSYNSGGWHFIALDSTTQYAQTAPGTAQYSWLQQDLQANANTACTMVYFHHPRYGLTSTNGNAYMQDIWTLLATSGVDVVLNGHEHNYSRWTPLDANGQTSADGLPQYIVGTGGHDSQSFAMSDGRVAARVRTDGALKLSLGADGGSAQFVDTTGAVRDSSTFSCRGGGGSAPDPTPTPSPTPSPAPDPSGSLTFAPEADAMVQEALPDQNSGKVNAMRSDTSPHEVSYLRFNVQGASQPITSAKLRLWVRDGTANAPAIAPSGDVTWSETAITWSNRPAVGTSGPDLGAVTTGTWIEYNVTSLVRGNGRFTLALVPQSSDALSVNTRESAADRPQLIVSGATGSTTPTPSPTPSPTATPSPTPAGGATEFIAVADARASEASPTTNYGTATLLQADGGADPDVESYLKFTVTGLTGAPTRATIKVFVGTGANAGSTNGPALYTAPSTWSETAITWSTRPARSTTALEDLGAVSAGTWIEYDVSSAITGNGDYTFVLATNSADATDFQSREAANKPRLILGGTSSAPTPNATAAAPAPTATTAAPTATTAAPTQAPSGSTAVPADADAMVQQAAPDTNAGTTNSMRADSQPMEVSYIRFTVPDGTEPITNATLRLWVRDNTAGTVDAPAVASSSDVMWSETGITWNNRPTPGATGPNFGAVGINTWIEYDVTSLVTGSGPVTLVLVPESNDGMIVNTREAATNKPELVITRGGTTSTSATTAQKSLAPAAATTKLASEPTATPPPTATPSPTATATATTATPQTGTVVNTGGEGLRCRTAPSTDGQVITTIPEGETVTVRGDQQGAWLPVTCAGQDGYVAAQYVVLNDAATTPVPTTTVTPAATTETPVPATDMPVQPVETVVPTKAPVATPLPVASGWQSDPNQPWTWLTDGDPATVWKAASEGEAGLDLGQSVALGTLRLLPTWPLAGTLEMQLSTDGTTWYHLTSVRLADQTPDTWLDLPAGYQARYARFLLTTPDAAPAVGGLAGVELWQAPDGVAQPLASLPPITPTPVPTESLPTAPPATELPPPTEAPVVEPTQEPSLPPTPTPEPAVVQPAPADTSGTEDAPGDQGTAPP